MSTRSGNLLSVIASFFAVSCLSACASQSGDLQRQAALEAFSLSQAQHDLADDERIGYRDIAVPDVTAMTGMTTADLAEFLELHLDHIDLLPVTAFVSSDQHIVVYQGFRGRGTYRQTSPELLPFEPVYRHSGVFERVYRNHLGFVFINGRLAFILDGDRVPNADTAVLDAWPADQPPYAGGFAEIRAQLESDRLTGAARFARFVGGSTAPMDGEAETVSITVAVSAPTIDLSPVELDGPAPLPANFPGMTYHRNRPWHADEINAVTTYPGDLAAFRLGQPLPEWPEYYEDLPPRSELVQRFIMDDGYELIGVTILPAYECSPYGGGCTYQREQRYWVGVREGHVDWLDADLNRLSGRNRENRLTARICRLLRDQANARPRLCR